MCVHTLLGALLFWLGVLLHCKDGWLQFLFHAV